MIALILSTGLVLFALVMLWLCNNNTQMVKDGDLEKGEFLFTDMLNDEYREMFVTGEKCILNKSDRKRFIIVKMKEDFKIKQQEEQARLYRENRQKAK